MAYSPKNYKIKVSCKTCNKEWLKLKYRIKEWSGNCMSCAKKNYKQTESHKKNVSLSMKGRTFTKEHLKNLSIAQIGDKGSNWQGGRTAINYVVRSLSLYKGWRFGVLSKDSFACTECGCLNNLQADHIKPLSYLLKLHKINTSQEAKNCPYLWDISNGRTLCIECHRKTDTYAGKLNRKLIILQ